MPTLALLDGHSLAYRAFFALPQELATTSGQVTNSVYGFMRMLVKLIGDHHPDRLAVAWDTGRQTFRSDRYPDCKAQRSATPDAFKSQLPLIDEEWRESALSNVRLNREIMEAWQAEFGDGGEGGDDEPDDDDPRGTESITRAGQ